MLIELRAPDDRLRGPKAVDAAPILTAALKAATDSHVDLSRLRVVCDYIQDRKNFREPVVLRRVDPWAIAPGGPETDGESWEVAIDLRRAKPDTVEVAIKSSLQQAAAGKSPQRDSSANDCGRVALESWGAGRRSLIWGFNSLYWKALSTWEPAPGKAYESALPTGDIDARNVEAVRDLM